MSYWGKHCVHCGKKLKEKTCGVRGFLDVRGNETNERYVKKGHFYPLCGSCRKQVRDFILGCAPANTFPEDKVTKNQQEEDKTLWTTSSWKEQELYSKQRQTFEEYLLDKIQEDKREF